MMPESFFAPSTSGQSGANAASDVEAGGSGLGAEASPLLGEAALLSQYAPDRE
jgi:hypothetical protein